MYVIAYWEKSYFKQAVLKIVKLLSILKTKGRFYMFYIQSLTLLSLSKELYGSSKVLREENKFKENLILSH